MNVSCPRCGADNDVEAPGLAVVCGSCFHSWVPSSEAADDGRAADSGVFAVGSGPNEPTHPGLSPPEVSDDGEAPTMEFQRAGGESLLSAQGPTDEPEGAGGATAGADGFDDQGTVEMPAGQEAVLHAAEDAEAPTAGYDGDTGAFAMGAGDGGDAGASEFGGTLQFGAISDTSDIRPSLDALGDELEDPPTVEASPSVADAGESFAQATAPGEENPTVASDGSFISALSARGEQADPRVGTYGRRTGQISHGEDVVWSGPEGAGPPGGSREFGTQQGLGPQGGVGGAAADPSVDPFSETDVVWPEDVGNRTTGGWGSDTGGFDAAGGASSTSTFGEKPGGGYSNDPYANNDPFGGGGYASESPFATQTGGEPFATQTGAAPFSTQTGGEPFGTESGGAPFSTQTGGDGFVTTEAPFGNNDPFGGGAQDPSNDPFAGADFATVDASVSGNPFGNAEFQGGDPGFMQDMPTAEADAPDLRHSSGFEVQATGGGAYGGAYGGAFDGGSGSGAGLLEIDPGGGSTPHPQTNQVAPQQKPGRKRRKGRGQDRRRAGRRRKRASSKVPALILLLMLAGLGGAYQLGLLDEVLGQNPPPKPPAQVKRPVAPEPAEAEQSAMIADAPTDYAKRIDELEAKLKRVPNDPNVRQDLIFTLMRLKERYPGIYKGNADYEKSLKKLLNPQELARDKRLLISSLLAQGKSEDAAAELERFVAEQTTNPDDLYLMARVARMRGDQEKATQYYLRVLKTEEGYQPALYDLGELYLDAAEIDISKARELFARLLELNPNHSGAKLAMAEIALYEKGYEQAKGLIDGALALAKETKNPDEQFRAFRLQAKLAESQGKIEDKRYALERATEIRPQDEPTALELANLLTNAGRPHEAVKRLQTCQAAGCASAGFYHSLVEAYQAVGKDDDAEKQLGVALKAHPEDTNLLILHAESELAKERIKTAKAIYAQVIEFDQTQAAAYMRLAELQMKENQFAEALDTLRLGVEYADAKLPLLEKITELHMRTGATLKAKDVMSEILKMDPNNMSIKLRFAGLLAKLGFDEEAARYYQDLDVAGALDSEDTLDFAEVLYRVKRYEDSMGHVESVLSRDPLNLKANILRGAVNTAQGLYRKADDDLRKALRVDAKSARAYYFLGYNELAQDRLPTAVEYLAKAISLDPSDRKARFQLARALTKVGGLENKRKALSHYSFIIKDHEVYNTSVDKDRIDPDVYLERGLLYFDNNQYPEALMDFKQAMLLDPTRQDLVIEFAKTLQRMGKHKEARAYLQEVLTRDPKNPSAHYLLGLIALDQSERPKAEDHFKQAIASGGANFPEAHRHLGFLYKDKSLIALSCDSFRHYLKVADRDAHDLEEIRRIVNQMCRR